MKRSPMKRSHRKDPVSPILAAHVFARDGGCVAPRLGGSANDCGGRLTLDHVKDAPMMGKRAPSTDAHLVTLCENHHLWNGWATSHRPELRTYLAGLLLAFLLSACTPLTRTSQDGVTCFRFGDTGVVTCRDDSQPKEMP